MTENKPKGKRGRKPYLKYPSHSTFVRIPHEDFVVLQDFCRGNNLSLSAGIRQALKKFFQ